MLSGYLPTGQNLRKAKLNLSKAVAWCTASTKCAGFTFQRPALNFVATGHEATSTYVDFKRSTKGFTANLRADGTVPVSALIEGSSLKALSCQGKKGKAGKQRACKRAEWITFAKRSMRASGGRHQQFRIHLPSWMQDPVSKYHFRHGYLPPGHALQPAESITIEKAALLCSGSKACAGFTFSVPSSAASNLPTTLQVRAYFKTTAAGFVPATASRLVAGGCRT